MKIVAALAVLMLLAGCGLLGDRPSEDEIADALRDPTKEVSIAGITRDDEVIHCIAQVLHDSDVSDEALRAVVDDDPSVTLTEDDVQALADAFDEMAACRDR